MKPIETIYKGYSFRSRLEARWAMVFNKLEIPYEYEREGYDLGGEWYLPDFWLPQVECFVEIKPKEEAALEDGIKKCQSLSIASDKRVLLIGGNPWRGEYSLIVFSRCHGECGHSEKHEHENLVLYPGEFGECTECRSIYALGMPNKDWSLILKLKGVCRNQANIIPNSRLLTEAFTAARQARFAKR